MPSEIDLQIEAFLQSATTRLAARSVVAYREDLQLWQAFFTAEKISSLTDIQAPQLRHFLLRERQRGVSVRSLRRRFAALRAWFRWLRQQDPQITDPSRGLPMPKGEQHFPDWLGIDVAQKLLDTQPDAGDDWLQLRDQAILELLYSSALRVSELVQLQRHDLHLEAGRLRVLGKGQKQRIVPVGRMAREALQRYLARRPESTETALFLNRLGRPLGVRGVQYLVDKAGRERLGQRLHPHSLRHSAASHLLQSSGDLRAVQEFLGHAQIDTTAIYTHLDYQHLAQVYDQAHPHAKHKEQSHE
ncbi:tyrosine recombinase XerC [Acidithiobacillus sp. CV18-2]|uniref:Tyrosine recombinase XerC n=1 Tax=Igneacidithiobacillus copahuensis TaxID=2724909 RepID=A0AAE2YQ74_9PROT|nr:tyrosine recombinase XerC [Igneacidithiobacillus copahuensis]MBU2753783.1 tyrosine recombinase XerC [Acidithiobacillus sp. CV18-3]MBU2756519.1 tyrosine recombinase XerC [Acidithiobacillus sp. BN09-2]MBU2776454.1 tyrosine recombinase XerC [Acidithiobacillus sp. CV18-2]MBU2795208.1 tyrosine recombinase XerC [Acidithiobacillus sp. VAN18-2]MBU2799164.1 tyrosine recombinase XerC [Acidithiobacillus sp. VAN18-4]UTV81196.1 tyrosine recombinase XerC [Acidithiobacillus sp. YTS05]